MKLWQQRITKNGFSSFFILLFYVFFPIREKQWGTQKTRIHYSLKNFPFSSINACWWLTKIPLFSCWQQQWHNIFCVWIKSFSIFPIVYFEWGRERERNNWENSFFLFENSNHKYKGTFFLISFLSLFFS